MLDYIFSWEALWWLLIPIYVLCSAALIVIVLLQKGKGVGFAGAFGVGAGSDTLFGPRSAKSLPHKLTYVSATVFMILALVMSMLSGRVGKGEAPDLVDENAPMESATMDALFDEAGGGGATGEASSSNETTTTVTPTPVIVNLDEAVAPTAPVESPSAAAPAEAPAAEAAEAPTEAPAEAPAATAPVEAPAAEAAETPTEAPAEAPAAEAPAPAAQ